jgi:carboxyl-terminal processing protease
MSNSLYSTQRTLPLIMGLFICLCLSLSCAIGFGAHRLWELRVNQSEPLAVFWEAWERVEQHFYGELPPARERTYGAIHGALALLNDPYTVFVEPETRELEQDEMRGRFGGIGVALWRDGEGRMVLSPYPDSPAEQADVHEGDSLIAIDGEQISGTTSVDSVRARLHGEVGTTVTLTISRPPTPPFDLTITRDEIQVPSVTWRVLDTAPDIGYIHIERFTERTGDEMLTTLRELKAAGITNLVLDLRDNYGGLIEPAVDTASQFLHTGVVLYELSRDNQERVFSVRSGGIATDTSLAVLVNGGTASAAEIVAGALQDQQRAVLIGETTYGKGSVQLIYEISDGSSLHVTSAIWLTPSRHQIEGQGLTPDIHVARADGVQDEQLDRAVTYLQLARLE